MNKCNSKNILVICFGLALVGVNAACGDTGSPLFNGTGQDPNDAGNVGGSASSSSGGDANGGSGAGFPCKPKSCLALAFDIANQNGSDAGANVDACGKFLDNCGEPVDCGDCSDPFQYCKGELPVKIFPDKSPDRTFNGPDNLCGGGCVSVSSQLNDDDCPYPKNEEFICTGSVTQMPAGQSNCVLLNSDNNIPPTAADWCCLRFIP